MSEQSYEELHARLEKLSLAREEFLTTHPPGCKVMPNDERELEELCFEIEEFKRDLRAFTSGNIGLIKEVMGKNFLDPEGYKRFFGVGDFGVPPPLPPDLLEVLESKCPFTKDGSLVKETHRLLYVPAKLDSTAFTINSLRELAEKNTSQGTIFHKDATWHRWQTFSQTPFMEGEWVLIFTKELPNTKNKTDDAQLEELKRYPEYETARALPLTAMLVLNALQNEGERLFSDCYGVCEERPSAGRRACVGDFDAGGLYVDSWVDGANPNVGRAVVRRFGKF